ncbi:GEVED domain-containing protein, partial [Hymenobacter gummosus]|uniref:GEVED domain-containing protein n=1 Tax=Hymenobacter gummosus TaxID=1776032 RepID=UPI001FB303D9
LGTTVTAGSAQTIYYSAGFTSTAYTEYWKLYIDYNQDGDFSDSGELVASRSSNSAITLSSAFTVPTTSKNGKTRLRVVMSDNSATTSGGSFSYGETE